MGEEAVNVPDEFVFGFAVVGYFIVTYFVVKYAVKSAFQEMMEASDVVYVNGEEEDRKEVM